MKQLENKNMGVIDRGKRFINSIIRMAKLIAFGSLLLVVGFIAVQAIFILLSIFVLIAVTSKPKEEKKEKDCIDITEED